MSSATPTKTETHSPAPRKGPRVDLDITRDRLERLGLSHASDVLSEGLGTATKEELAPHRFLDGLLETELQHREGMRPTNRVADGAPGSGQARPRCQPSVPSVICRKGLAASRC